MHFVSSTIYHKAVSLALKEGLSPVVLRSHKEMKEVREGARYLPIQLLFEVYETADENLAPGFSVRQGSQLVSEDYGTLGLAWRTCWYASDVLSRTQRFMILATDHGSATFDERNGKTMLVINRPAIRRGLEMANETSFVMMTNVLREVTGKVILPISVSFQHSSSTSGEFEKFFKAPVKFNAPDNSITFSTKSLEAPTLKADRHIQQYLIERLKEEQENIRSQADNLLKEIRVLIMESLPSGIPSLTQVADHVALSPRTLKRRLAEKSLSFRELVQEIQKEVAIANINSNQYSISEITFLTGFSDQSAFNRAFKRWTGKAPSAYKV